MTKFSLICAATLAGLVSANEILIPDNFDTRTEWYGCGMATLNQGQCGSCWAVSATGVFGERMCIWKDDKGQRIPKEGNKFIANRMFQKAGACSGEGTMHAAHNHGCKRTAQFLSPQPLLSCGHAELNEKLYPDSAGCNGGEAHDAWRYFLVNGISTMTLDGAAGCTPYTSGRCAAKDPFNNGCKSCDGMMNECEDTGLKPVVHKIKSFGWIMEEGLKPRAFSGVPRPESDLPLMKKQVEKMQIELMTNGPLHICIDYFDNFGSFFNENPLGIYNSTEKLPKSGGHCLSIIGWGSDKTSGFDFWLIRNSWGAEWGTDGIFRFQRGVDLCGVESDVWAACPEGTDCELTKGVYRMEHTHSKDDARHESRLKELFLTTGDVAYTPRSLREVEVRQPSQRWKGGNWYEMPRDDFSNKKFGLRVAHAYEHVFNEPTSIENAVKAADKVWSQVVGNGLKIRVRFNNSVKESLMHHTHDGKITKL